MIPDFYKSGSYFDAIDKVSLTDSNMSEGAGSYIDQIVLTSDGTGDIISFQNFTTTIKEFYD